MLPSDRFLYLFAAGLIPALAGAGNPSMLLLALGYDLALLLLFVIDRFVIAPAPEFLRARRDVLPAAPLARPLEVTLHLRNLSARSLELLYRDLPPLSFQRSGEEGRLPLPGRSRQERTYEVQPLHRGTHDWGGLTLRYRTRLGLVWRQMQVPLETRVRVHPDPRPRSQEEAIAMRMSRQGPTGMRLALVRGEGREFESLREYRPDDEYRRIDWKATARKGEFIVRQYEAERDQRVLILLDCGRAMGVRVGNLTKLDRLVEAALRLGRVAVESGDRVGLIAFSGTVKNVVPPGKGQTQLRRLAEVLTDLRADNGEPDYETAFARGRQLVHRRALVVLLTEISGERAGKSLRELVRAATPRHLPVVLTIVDREVAQAAALEPKRISDPWLMAVARDLQESRSRVHRLLRAGGAHAVEIDPERLSLEAVRRYLDIKARGIL